MAHNRDSCSGSALPSTAWPAASRTLGSVTLFRAISMSATTPRFDAGAGLVGWTSTDTTRSSARAVGSAVELSCARTDLGAAEVRRPVRDLARPARELLFLIDKPVAVDPCVSEVHEAELADAMLLLGMGLIRTTSFDASSASRPVRMQLRPLIDALLVLSSDDLYTLLTQQAKRRLGLLQGFRMVLALERCNGHHEQRALAVRFIQEIWRTHGVVGIRPLQGLLKA